MKFCNCKVKFALWTSGCWNCIVSFGEVEFVFEESFAYHERDTLHALRLVGMTSIPNRKLSGMTVVNGRSKMQKRVKRHLTGSKIILVVRGTVGRF